MSWWIVLTIIIVLSLCVWLFVRIIVAFVIKLLLQWSLWRERHRIRSTIATSQQQDAENLVKEDNSQLGDGEQERENTELIEEVDGLLAEQGGVIESTVLVDKAKENAYRERFWSDVHYLQKKGKREEYEKKLIEGLALQADNSAVIKELAHYYFTYQNNKKALPLLKRILEQDPNDHKTLWQMAEIYLENNDLETSELLVTKALKFSENNPKYAITLTEVYYHTGRLDDAIEWMEQVVKWRPSSLQYREALAKLYMEAKEYELALQCYQSIIEIDPSNSKAKRKVLEVRNFL